MVIQLPILFALYPVIQEVPRYVNGIKEIYMPVVNQIMATDGYQKILEKIGNAAPVYMPANAYDYTDPNILVRVLYKFQDSTWNTLVDKMPSLETVVDKTTATMGHLNTFLGINIGEQPLTMLMDALKDFSIVGIILAVIIPIMAGLTQFISVKLMQQQQTNDDRSGQSDGKIHEFYELYYAVVLCIYGIYTAGRSWSVLGDQCDCKMCTADGDQ